MYRSYTHSIPFGSAESAVLGARRMPAPAYLPSLYAALASTGHTTPVQVRHSVAALESSLEVMPGAAYALSILSSSHVDCIRRVARSSVVSLRGRDRAPGTSCLTPRGAPYESFARISLLCRTTIALALATVVRTLRPLLRTQMLLLCEVCALLPASDPSRAVARTSCSAP